MSCVIGFLFKNFALISADRRAIKEDIIIDENIHKIFKVNDKVLLSLTGSAAAIPVLEEHGYLSAEDCPSPKEYLEFLFLMLGGNRVREENQSNVLVLGNHNGEGYGGNFHMAEFELQNEIYISEGFECWTPILTPPDVDYYYYTQLVRERTIDLLQKIAMIRLFSRGVLIKELKVLHKEIISQIADEDFSVNKNIEHTVLKW